MNERFDVVRRHARLWHRFVMQAVVRETQYRASFVATLVVGVIQLVLSLIPVLLLYSFAEEVNGWSQGEVIALTGMFQAVMGMLAMTVQPNVNRFSEYVRGGDLDLILVRPVSAQFTVSLRWLSLAEGFNVLVGVAVIAVGLARAGHAPTLVELLQTVVLTTAGLVLVACAWSAVAYLAFWLTSSGAMPVVVHDVMQAGRFPLAFYPLGVRLFLAAVLPIGVATTLPVEALTGRGGWPVVLGAVAFAVLSIQALRWWWAFAVRHYSSASS